jgi:hypothetical protein
VNIILAGQSAKSERGEVTAAGASVGMAADLPPVEPNDRDLVAIAAGAWDVVQARIEALDAALAQRPADELAVRRTRRAAARVLASSAPAGAA